MASNENHPPPSPTGSAASGGSSTLSNPFTEKGEHDTESPHDETTTQRRSPVFDDVAIPAGILRAASNANRCHKRTSCIEDEEKANPRQSMVPEDFSVLDIAREQRQQADELIVGNADPFSDPETDAHEGLWRTTTLHTVDERTQLDPGAAPRRWSSRRLTPIRTTSRRSVQHDMTALPTLAQNDAVMYRSLNNYKLKDELNTRGRPLSEAIAPDADFVSPFADSHALDADEQMPGLHQSTTNATNAPDEKRTQNVRKAALQRLCMRGRDESVVGPAVQTVKNGTTDLLRRNSLLDVYDKAKIRGQQLQRKKWVQWTFEGTCYLLILCFIYFVLVGRPIWNGAVWWLYWVVNKKFTVAGTWSITIGMALFYAYAPLLIQFEKEPPMPDEAQLAEARQSQDVKSTALLIPCYKSAQLIGSTLAAALKIFPAQNIFVIANGNSPTPLDNTEEICLKYGVNHVWSPVGSKIVAQYVGCYSAKGFENVLLIDDDCALPPHFPIVSDRLTDMIKCIGYTIKSVGPPENPRGTLCQQAQDLEYKISGLQRAFAGKIGSATFPHGAISLWNTKFLIDTFRTHPGFSVSEDWFFGHTARKLGSRVTMCSSVFVETETPTSIFFSSGSRGGFGEMTIFSQRFYRWNFFFVNGIYYNMAYILGSWKLGWWEIGAKIFVFQEVYETLLYLLAPFVLPISLIVRPVFCVYMLIATVGMYYINVTIFNEVHLRRRNERIGWVAVYIYYTPYKIILTFVNVFSCYYSLWKYAKYFAKRHPKIIEDEKAVEVVLRLEETTPKRTSRTSQEGGGRRLTVTAVGSRLSWVPTRNSRASMASVVTANPEVTRPQLAHMNSRSSRRVVSVYHQGRPSLTGRVYSTGRSTSTGRPVSTGRPISGSELPANQMLELTRSNTIDFAEGGGR